MRPLPLLLRRLSPSPLPLSRLIRPQYQPQPQRLLLLRTTSSAAAAATAPTETAAAPPPLATRELPASAQLRRLSAVPHRGQLRGLLCHMLPDNTLWNRAARERGVPVRLYRLAIRELIAHLSQTRGGDTADTGTAGRAANRGQDETARMLAPWTAEDDGAADDAAVPLTGGATAESHALRMAHHRPEDDDEEDGETLESAREAEQDDALADELLQLPNTVLSHAEMAALLREACGRPCTHNTYLEPNKRLPAMHRLHSRLVKRLKAYGHELQALHLEKHMPLLDKTQPQLPFLVARGYKRRFIIHRGPTNSGKTFGAMQQLLNAERGMFLAPLRLLAWEQHEKMLNHGIKADLTTGQERLISLDSTHLASTVEMADFSTDYDVAVIDECQILGDPQRGQSWTRAILGVKAKTIVCIEDGSATEIIKDMVRSVGEEPEIRQFTRLAPLQVATEPIASFRDLQPGDCLIAFGRRHLFGMKAHIEQQLGVKCAIVYGSLPPETRKEQSKLFNDPDSDYKFLVASDAIGMGLNFNIRRVIFSQLHKHDGDLHRQLTTGEIRQIAGRAGRYGTEFGEGGVVTTLGTKKYLEVIRRALDPSVQLPNIEYAYLGISPEEFISFQEQLSQPEAAPVKAYLERFMPPGNDGYPTHQMGPLKKALEQLVRLPPMYEMAVDDDLASMAHNLRDTDVGLKEMYRFCRAPVQVSSPTVTKCMLDFANKAAANKPVKLAVPDSFELATSLEELEVLENMHRIMDMYMWLANALGMAMFPKYAEVAAKRVELADVISRSVQTAFRVDEKIMAAALPKGQVQAEVAQPKTSKRGGAGPKGKKQARPRRSVDADGATSSSPSSSPLSLPQRAWGATKSPVSADLLPPVILVPAEEPEAEGGLLAALQQRHTDDKVAPAASADEAARNKAWDS